MGREPWSPRLSLGPCFSGPPLVSSHSRSALSFRGSLPRFPNNVSTCSIKKLYSSPETLSNVLHSSHYLSEESVNLRDLDTGKRSTYSSGAKGFSQELVMFISLEKSLLWSVLFSEPSKKLFHLACTLAHQIAIFSLLFPQLSTSLRHGAIQRAVHRVGGCLGIGITA